MGKFIYGPVLEIEFDDRMLAHIKEIVIAKLAKQESFLMNWHPEPNKDQKLPRNSKGESKRLSLWINPAIPIQFKFFGSKDIELNPQWLEALEETSHSIRGLEILQERQVEDYLESVRARKEQLLNTGGISTGSPKQ